MSVGEFTVSNIHMDEDKRDEETKNKNSQLDMEKFKKDLAATQELAAQVCAGLMLGSVCVCRIPFCSRGLSGSCVKGLKDGGSVVVSTPHVGGLYSQFLLWLVRMLDQLSRPVTTAHKCCPIPSSSIQEAHACCRLVLWLAH